MAPGNFVRPSGADNSAFEALPFFQKIRQNFFPIININVGRINFILMTLISCAVILIGLLLWKRCRKKRLLFSIGLIIDCGYLCLAAGNYVFGLWDTVLPWATVVWIINTIVFFAVFGVIWDNSLVIALCCAAVCSQAMLILSPTIAARSAIIFQYPMIVIMLIVFAQFSRGIDWRSPVKQAGILAYLLFAAVMLGNGMRIGIGYYQKLNIG